MIELKLEEFQAAHKGQMELYLRWLNKYARQPGEEAPIGLILCGEAGGETVELLELDASSTRVASCLTQLPSRELLQQKLHTALEVARNRLEAEKSSDRLETTHSRIPRAGAALGFIHRR